MKEGFEPKSFKNYNLTLAEQIELDKFPKEILTFDPPNLCQNTRRIGKEHKTGTLTIMGQ